MESRGYRFNGSGTGRTSKVYAPGFSNSDSYGNAYYRSARLASQTATAEVLPYPSKEAPVIKPVEPSVKPSIDKKPKHEKEWVSLADYFRKTEAGKKLVICSVLLSAALVALFAIVGSVSVSAAQLELNELNEQISDVNSAIGTLETNLSGIVDTDAACVAAVESGMSRSAISTPIHP